jgi:hypothetical protein
MTDKMRMQYRPLTDVEKSQIVSFKSEAAFMSGMIDALVKDEDKERRYLEVAQQRLEECVMWVTKFITGPSK